MMRTRIKPENPNANLKNYRETYKNFSWSSVEKEFSRFDRNKINIVTEAVDRWAFHASKKNHPALIYERAGKVETFTFTDLRDESCRWANLLVEKGFKPGDRLFIFQPPCPETYLAMLACARLGVIFSNLYPGLGFDELEWMLHNGEPRGILTHPDLVERLLQHTTDSVCCILLTGDVKPGIFQTETLIEESVQRMPKAFTNRLFPAETPLYFLYTSGSTGPPKAVVHAHQDMVGYVATAKYVLDLTPDTVLWTDGEPAWVTGTVYGAFAPWLCGVTSVVQADPFSASTYYRTIERYKVSVWYSTPMTIRRLMDAGDDLPGRYDFSRLRHVATVGAALTPDLFFWVKENLKHTPHDTWWMTETGMICIANFPSEQTRPGSMGKPVPGVQAAVLDEDGSPLPLLTLGELALKANWPCMMREIWRDEERYNAYFRNGWFLTGDMVIKDEDDYYYHQGRNDDLIKVGQKFIGPYEIERVICVHPAVTEAAVIAEQGSKTGPRIKSFVKIRRDLTPSARLTHEIRAFVKANLHADLPLTAVEIVEELPKTRSGKLLRRVLRARELGLPSGETVNLKD